MAKGKKSSLKAALSSQQSRLKRKQEASQSAQLAEKKAQSLSQSTGKPKGKGKEKAVPPRVTVPFKPTDRVLLIGEGNFSFTRALVFHPPPSLEFLPASNVTGTAYDTEEECYEKYPESVEIVASLREKGVQIIFEVDGTKLEKHPVLKVQKWDKVVWNFPHAGKGIQDQDRNILSNQVLIMSFLRSVACVLARGPAPTLTSSRKRKRRDEDDEDDVDVMSEDEKLANAEHTTKTRGSVLITLRNVAPYTLWGVPKLAKDPPPAKSAGANLNPQYVQLRSFVFHRSQWQGYEHRMTKGERAHGQGKTGEGGEDRTWEFYLKD